MGQIRIHYSKPIAQIPSSTHRAPWMRARMFTIQGHEACVLLKDMVEGTAYRYRKPWVSRKACKNGENITPFRGMAFVASDMGWPWTGCIGPAPLQMSRCCLGAALSWFVWWAVAGFGRFSLTLRFSVNSHLDHSRAWILACLPTAALLHRCFPSNLSVTTQGAIVKLRGASSELCTLFIWSVCRTVKLRLPAVRELF